MRKNQTWVHRFSSSDLTWDYKVTKCKDNVPTNYQSSTKGKKYELMSTLPEGYPCSRWAVFEGVSCRGIGNGPSSPSPNVVGTLNPSEPLMFLWIHPSQHKCQASSCIICWSNQPCNVLNPSEPADVMLVKLCIHPNQLINIYMCWSNQPLSTVRSLCRSHPSDLCPFLQPGKIALLWHTFPIFPFF